MVTFVVALDPTFRVVISEWCWVGKIRLGFLVTSRVPQCSILAPTLVLLFINDLPDLLEISRCLLFAEVDVQLIK